MSVRYLKVQWKKAVQILPYLLCYLLAAGIILTIFFTVCSKALAQENMAGKMNIGVVTPEDDETAELAVSLVTSMDSVNSICCFDFLTEEEGDNALRQGTVYALIKIPENLVQGILNGTNTPITIVTMQDAGMETKLFQTLSDSGISILSLAQAGIYATDEYCLQTPELLETAKKINQELNQLYMKYAMSRTDLFGETEISATGDLSFIMYYLGAGLVLLIMLSGVPYAFYFCNRNRSVEQKLKVQGLTAMKRIVLDYAAIGVLHMLIVGSLLIIVYFLKGKIGIRVFDYMQVCIACEILALSSLAVIQFIYTVCGQLVWGMFSVFFATILLVFLAGGFIPLVFLPDIFSDFTKWLPSSYWIRMMGQGLQSELQIHTLLASIGVGIVCLGASCVVAGIAEGRREHR